ncbi:helix-turn-helix domain-containing protein [Tianweitania populi]|uniref:Helix-turn-helix domain-containing protein n=1 Tax=Tianweitania populi TaxID=1607949 RepID=A0A8J3DMS1_9HYPH|nr:helix-turn-helix domain-containing protein [Tianweitania populi]GHD07674.1 hypothetical protein GCM10016234_06350 [Tianweitania populi]
MSETIPLLVVAGKAAFSVEGFCEAFGIGRNLVYDQIKDKRLKIRKVGRRTIIRAEDAKAWLDALPEGPD